MHHLADRRGVVEDVAEVAAQARGVERARARERDLLADGEQQLDVDRRALRGGRGARAPAARRPRPCCRRRGSPRWRSPSRRRRAPARPAPAAAPCRGARTAAASAPARPASRAPAPAVPAGIAREQVAAVRARRAAPASSSRTSTPSARSSAITRSAQARSRPEGLSIRHSSAKVPLQVAALELADARDATPRAVTSRPARCAGGAARVDRRSAASPGSSQLARRPAAVRARARRR